MGLVDGKVVVIAGGTSGIGRAAALLFAREGARVVVAARGVERGNQVIAEIHTQGGEAIFIPTDIARADQVSILIAQTVERFGRLDCAFNNAADTEGALKPLVDFDEAGFDRAMATNLKGIWLLMKAEIQQMLRQEPTGGAIVNTSSVNGLGGAPVGSLYSAAKAGILALTKSAALEYASRQIRINALVAGAFRTPMLEQVFEIASGGDPQAKQRVEQRYVDRIPLGRIGRPEEAAEAALWLCSDRSSFVTGHSLIVDGAQSAPYR